MRAQNHQICCDMGIRQVITCSKTDSLVVDSKLSLTKQFIGATCNAFEKE
jgi:hypothetical protein